MFRRNMMRLKIIGGSSSQALAERVARELGQSATKVDVRRFPDGEKYLRVLEDVKGQSAVIIQSMHPAPDEHLLEYFLLVDMLKDLGANKIIAFIPYFAYARQDTRFNPGEAVSFKTVTKLIEKTGTDELYTFDMHLHRVRDISEVFEIPAHNLSAFPLLADHIQRNIRLRNAIVIAPDEEAEQWARVCAQELKADYDVLKKRRVGDERVEIRPGAMNLTGRDVVMVDDIISTGGTIAEATRAALQLGANKVVIACTHPILAGNALAKIYAAGAETVIGTDTVPSAVSVVSVAPVIADQLRRLKC